jgi:phosphotransferase system enzyme I (PtsI)
VILHGIGVSPGIAFGRALLMETPTRRIFRLTLDAGEVDAELERFEQARRQATAQLRDLRARMAEELGEDYASIFDAHLLLVQDSSLMDRVGELIREEQANAEWALRNAAQGFLARLLAVPDPYLRERGTDLQDVHDRLQGLLAGNPHQHDLSELHEDTVVVAASLSPSDAVLLKHPRVVAFATDAGGRTSHTAILANALAVPAVVGLHEASHQIQTGQSLVVDGSSGVVEVDPRPEVEARYRAARTAFLRHEEELVGQAGPTTTADGERVVLLANIEFPEEMDAVRRAGAEGVGLYRSEFLFLSSSPHLPTEGDHEGTYRRIARAAHPLPVTIRTLDLGGEKYFHEVIEAEESNPVLGLRAVRLCLRRPDIFHAQIRGLLRAASEGNIRIMFPLISGLDELRRVKDEVYRIHAELAGEGIPPVEDLKIGIMVEVPSAATTADLLAPEVDFFSIGTNDLIQYTLAIDRSNETVSYLYQPFHPAILRMVRDVVAAGRRGGIDVDLCGEMANDPLGAIVLLGLGLRSLSLNPSMLPEIRDLVRTVSVNEITKVVDRALTLGSPGEIQSLFHDRFARWVPPVRPVSPGD